MSKLFPFTGTLFLTTVMLSIGIPGPVLAGTASSTIAVLSSVTASTTVMVQDIMPYRGDQPTDSLTSVTPFLEPGEKVDTIIHGRVHVANTKFGGATSEPQVSSLYFFDEKGKLIVKRRIVPVGATLASTRVFNSQKYIAVKRACMDEHGQLCPKTVGRNRRMRQTLMLFDLSGKALCEIADIKSTLIVLDDDLGRFMIIRAGIGEYEIRSVTGKLIKHARFSAWEDPRADRDAIEIWEGEESPIIGHVTHSEEGRLLAVTRTANLSAKAFYELTLLRFDGSQVFQMRVAGSHGAAIDIWLSSKEVVVFEHNQWSNPPVPPRVALFGFSGRRLGQMTRDEYNRKRASMKGN